ncbi:ribosomal RNA-processing protein 9 [Diaporthe helianthi]|uniref:Ribosomal RNA-processing protein 9 n=1 Tax=Diaporthe helianthi TaxID=158607 RepID=A0A2P5IEX3_DIAHE|nr:ribosomal RNA-processing protein 9 [Diaporthe helianthi]
MSSFFTAPGAANKRKRQTSAADSPKKRLATSSNSIPVHKLAGKTNRRPGNPAPKKQVVERDSSISGSDSEDDDLPDDEDEFNGIEDDDSGSEAEGETAAERRLRLAERYLDNVKGEVQDEYGFDAEEIDRDLIAERMQEDVAETKGKVYRQLAGELLFEQASHTIFRWNSQNVNSIATCAPYAYTVSKDMFLVKWKLQDLPQHQWPQTTKKKPKKPPAPPKKKPQRVALSRGDSRKTKDKNYQGHTGPILKVAASQDGKYVVTAGADRRMVVHDAETLKPIRAFTQHRDAVTGLAFRRGTNQLYSSSKDRTVKVWSLNELAYVETLFGHQDHVVDIDALAQERCVSVGARDRTARLWKVVEETQLVFRGGGSGISDKKKDAKPTTAAANIDPLSMAHEGSMDRIAMIDDEMFVTGSDNGSIALWSLQKKKPVFVLPHAHGIEPALAPEKSSGEIDPDPSVIPPPQPRWITALRTVPYSDLILSGSWDGYVRVWKLSEDKRRLERVGVLGATSDEHGNVLSHNPQPQFPNQAPLLTNGDAGEEDEPKVNGNNSSPSQEVARRKAAEEQDEEKEKSASPSPDSALGLVKGVINDISTFERGDRGRDGLCVVIALGKEHRLGRWKKLQGGRNGAMVFEVPRVRKEEVPRANGVVGHESAEEGGSAA